MISTSVPEGFFSSLYRALPVILEKDNPSLPGECVLEFFWIAFLYSLNAWKQSGMSFQP